MKVAGRISPDGKFLSWIAPRDGVLNIWVAPADNLAAAKTYAPEGLKIIPVRTFDEALDAIRSLPPRGEASKQAAD